ncbi:hypothetical protein E2562_019557 [Oryza meyeriana var. granulata]|uniref:MPN domain-containing protein n=1 Tax=Oryza meyeriana var. granulata TaxID=110450 RepID=A0A6G1BY09_9ORYZ|nr:hypothetical protein E2562_019557 [Oryza meyeriana var. granulata]
MGAECKYEVAQAAYVKLALHALKHPAVAVNGLLVGRLLDGASSPPAAVVSVADAVPLSHQPHHLPLLPTLELALTLVEDHFAAQGLAVVGYYHANARRDDAELPAVAKRVGDHIFRNFPRAAVLLLDNKKLEEAVKGKSREPVVQDLLYQYKQQQKLEIKKDVSFLFLPSFMAPTSTLLALVPHHGIQATRARAMSSHHSYSLLHLDDGHKEVS